MEITISVAELGKALQRVQGIVEKKTSMPILGNALLRSSGQDRISVSATDLEIGITGEYRAEVHTEGAMTLAARALYDIVRQLPGDDVVLKQAPNQYVEISCGKVKYRVVGLPAEGIERRRRIAAAVGQEMGGREEGARAGLQQRAAGGEVRLVQGQQALSGRCWHAERPCRAPGRRRSPRASRRRGACPRRPGTAPAHPRCGCAGGRRRSARAPARS